MSIAIVCEPPPDCRDPNVNRWHCMRGHEGAPAGVCPLAGCQSADAAAAIHAGATATQDEFTLADEHLLHLPVPIGGDPFHRRYHQRCSCGWDSGPGIRADVRKRADQHLTEGAPLSGEPDTVGAAGAVPRPDPGAGSRPLPSAAIPHAGL